MKVNDFLSQLQKASKSKTLYVMGGFGAPAGYGSNRTRYSNNQPYNKRPERTAKIKAASDDTFFFDCVGLIKGILWGWNALTNRVYGGADYASNNVPDIDAKEMMFSGCKDAKRISTIADIEPGEFLWFDGHCGVYLGNGKTIESTPSGSDGVQIRNYDSRWTYHGHLKYVDYSGVQPTPTPTPADYTPGNLYKVTCKGPLRIRTSPDTKSDLNIIDNLYRGDKIECRETAKDSKGRTWIRIDGWTCAEESGVKYIE